MSFFEDMFFALLYFLSGVGYGYFYAIRKQKEREQ